MPSSVVWSAFFDFSLPFDAGSPSSVIHRGFFAVAVAAH